MKKLRITPFTFDIYLLFNDNMTTIVGLQTDDSLIVDIIKFMNIKSRKLYVVDLMIKSYERLTPKQPLNFNDFIIIFNNKNSITINQMKQIKKI